MEETHICPRCCGLIPSNEHPGKYPGAISRADNITEICSTCGVEEAILDTHTDDWTAMHRSKEFWPIILIDHPLSNPAVGRMMKRMEMWIDKETNTPDTPIWNN